MTIMSPVQPDIVQTCWKELCLIICPGSMERYRSCMRIIEAGPPAFPIGQAAEEMNRAARLGILTRLAAGTHFGSPERERLVENRYPALQEYMIEVFPA